ncbi:topoisomerase [Pseudomonas cichorii]|nr:topoisomerase [Pseudomonas cichorii]MBX8524880.1 topoisomerase [Pseudomonas cichorii]MBX8538329.1 topoisomerase [Pseudomonas cichorii]MBX8578223.1 topoisomerase [Pseudomonas cichorii]
MSRKPSSSLEALVHMAGKLPEWLSKPLTSWLARRKPHNEPESPATVKPHVQQPIPAAPVIAVRESVKKPAPPKPVIEPVAPKCPHCKKTMIMKVARTGGNAGGDFWGCKDYPKCRGMRGIFRTS